MMNSLMELLSMELPSFSNLYFNVHSSLRFFKMQFCKQLVQPLQAVALGQAEAVFAAVQLRGNFR